jgi:murein DD-endopeptidase MepM/ murein hydrolase activator NlpD
MVSLYDWWNNLEIARSVRIYFISLGAIFFQYNILAGIIISIGLLYHSRISFTLSLVGFFTAYFFYELTGASITDLNYSYIGFNYILTSIAIGGFFIIPSWKSYIWTVILVPMVAILTISMSAVFSVFALPIFALPFNIVVLLFLYVLKFRVKPSPDLAEVVVQQNSPEKNLYSYVNDIGRFRPNMIRTNLPFYGMWEVSQAHDGAITHKGDWRHAWDFIITDGNGQQYKSDGNELEDYFCYKKPVTAVADGTVESITDNIADNPVGVSNTRENWGNTVIIKHGDFLYSSLSHLVPGSIIVKEGQRVRRGEKLGLCGNSGRSPYPHLHFQMQYSQYIGSKTLDYPIGYYLGEEGQNLKLFNYGYPAKGQKLMNVKTTELLTEAFDFVPGRQLTFAVILNGVKHEERWEVLTDEYNNSFIKCDSSGSVAYFENDGKMMLFRHYKGSKDNFLYWFYLALYRVQLGYYDGVVVEDDYPVNLFFRRRILFIQDFAAPFIKFLRSKYILEYKSIDSEISPSLLKLESCSINSIGSYVTREIKSDIEINERGIGRMRIVGRNINIEAECKE